MHCVVQTQSLREGNYIEGVNEAHEDDNVWICAVEIALMMST